MASSGSTAKAPLPFCTRERKAHEHHTVFHNHNAVLCQKFKVVLLVSWTGLRLPCFAMLRKSSRLPRDVTFDHALACQDTSKLDVEGS